MLLRLSHRYKLHKLHIFSHFKRHC